MSFGRTTLSTRSRKKSTSIALQSFPLRPRREDQVLSHSLKTNKTEAPAACEGDGTQAWNDYAAQPHAAFIQAAVEDTYGKGADRLDCVLIITAANK